MDHELAFLDGLLLPRTLLRAPPCLGKSTQQKSQDFDSVRSYILSSVLDSSKEAVEQAKEALVMPLEGSDQAQNGDSVDDRKYDPQGRRQGLGLHRKRARFSMRPSASQVPTGMNLSSKVDHIADPEEYFAAVEKMALAEKELRKLRGEVSTDLIKDHLPRTARQRRPGLLGKRASFRPFSVAQCDNTGPLLLSPDVQETRNSSPHKSITNKKCNIPVVDDDLSHISQNANKENVANSLINKLLSSYGGLDDHEELASLQEHLQLKSFTLDKIRLPVTPPDIWTTTNVNGILVGANSFSQKQKQIDILTDPYVFLPDNAPTAGEPSPSSRNGITNAFLHQNGSTKPSELAINMEDISSPSSISGSRPGLNELLFTSPLSKRGSKLNSDAIRNSSYNDEGKSFCSEIAPDEPPTGTSPCTNDKTRACFSGRNDCDSRIELIGIDSYSKKMDENLEASICKGQDNILDNLHPETLDPGEGEDLDGSFNRTTDFTNAAVASPKNVFEFLEGMMDEALHEEYERLDSEDQSTSAQDGSTIAVGDPESIIEEQHNKALLNRQRQNSLRQPRRLKTSRKSLAEAGTRWEGGVRRSTRIRFRPLEHWRGERLLYGRIHESLATVIGVKCSSPGGQDLKIKSYVSEEHAKLVEKAAAY